VLVLYSLLALVGLVGTWWLNVLSSSGAQGYLQGSFAVAVAFTFPVFLVLRERHLRRHGDPAAGPGPRGARAEQVPA